MLKLAVHLVFNIKHSLVHALKKCFFQLMVPIGTLGTLSDRES